MMLAFNAAIIGMVAGYLLARFAMGAAYRAALRDRDAARKSESEAKGDLRVADDSIAGLVTTNMHLRRSLESARLKLAINGIDVTRESLPAANGGEG